MRGPSAHTTIVSLDTLCLRSAVEPIRSHEEHRHEQEVRGDAAESAAYVRIQIARRETLEQADRNGAHDRAGYAVESADDHDREDFEPDEHHAKPASRHEGPEDAGKHGQHTDQRPRDRE